MKIKSNKWTILFICTSFLALVTVGNLPAEAAGFHYEPGPIYKEAPNDNIYLYYEITEDYSIDLFEYFDDKSKLPSLAYEIVVGAPSIFIGIGFIADREEIRQDLVARITAMPAIKWDFIKLSENGVLTIKKGYRWDGASTPRRNSFRINTDLDQIRGSCVHDAIYDLMRLGYLTSDDFIHHYSQVGYKNRLLADNIMFMIFREDGKSAVAAQIEWATVRIGGSPKTKHFAQNKANDEHFYLLAPWKFHISELRTWSSNGNVDLHFQPADYALKDPDGYGSKQHEYTIERQVGYLDDLSSWTNPQKLYEIQDVDTSLGNYYNENSEVFVTDETASNSEVFLYSVTPTLDEQDLPAYKKHWDFCSNKAPIAPAVGSGNALSLDGIDDYMTSGDVTEYLSGDSITFEAWVYPEEQEFKSAILSFNTPNIGSEPSLIKTSLIYDGDIQTFCYYDALAGNPMTFECSNTEYVPGQWYHVAVTIDHNDQGRLYLNGILDHTFTTSIRPLRNGQFSIGRDLDANSPLTYFEGKIDEARVWAVAQSHDKIGIGACAPLRGDETDLLGLWHFDEPDGYRETIDTTLYVNHGILGGGASFSPSGAMKPEAVAKDIILQLDDTGNASITADQVDNGSYDICGIASITVSPNTFTCENLGENTVTLTVTNIAGASDSSEAKVTVVDRLQPELLCNTPDTIIPPDVPISFTAIAKDNCEVSMFEITEYDCFKFTKKDKLINKINSCEVSIEKDTTTILDSGGVGDHITWSMFASDGSGNVSEEICEILVKKPSLKRKSK